MPKECQPSDRPGTNMTIMAGWPTAQAGACNLQSECVLNRPRTNVRCSCNFGVTHALRDQLIPFLIYNLAFAYLQVITNSFKLTMHQSARLTWCNHTPTSLRRKHELPQDNPANYNYLVLAPRHTKISTGLMCIDHCDTTPCRFK